MRRILSDESASAKQQWIFLPKKIKFEYANGYWIEDSHGIQICAVHWLYSDYLCETLPSQCQVQSSTIIIAIVIAIYLFKIVFIALTLWHLGETTLVTIGNAIQLFIVEPNFTTADCCLMSRHNVNKKWEDANSWLCERYIPSRRGSYSAITSISSLYLMVRKLRSSLWSSKASLTTLHTFSPLLSQQLSTTIL
jgi:hypothetical protein